MSSWPCALVRSAGWPVWRPEMFAPWLMVPIETVTGGRALTVIAAAPETALFAFDLATIAAVPGATAVMVTCVDGPAALTVTTAVLLLDQSTVRSVTLPVAVTLATKLAVCV